MKIGLFGLQFFDEYTAMYQSIIDKLFKENCTVSIYEPLLQKINGNLMFPESIHTFNNHLELIEQVEILFCIGGDGSILDSVTLIKDSGIPVLGINFGRLGFLSSVSKSEINFAIQEVLNNRYIIDKRTLLKLDTSKNHFENLNFALNELTVQKKDNISMIVVHVYINDLLLSSYWADGLIIATPTGSTAYSLSCGGPIVMPSSENFIITPIASHNLTVRPIIIPNDSIIKLKMSGRSKNFMIGLDSRFESVGKSEELIINKCDFTFNLIQMSNRSFFDTIREKLHWGSDIRN